MNDDVTAIKPGQQTTGNGSSSTLFPTLGRVYVWTTPKEAYNPECLVLTVKHSVEVP
jgi:hypothetical protein